jgi:YD repeat-containing protein
MKRSLPLQIVLTGLCLVPPPAALADALFDARGFTQNRPYFGQAPVEHVDPATGNVTLTFTDLVLPGNAGFDLKIQRTYNSKIYVNPTQPDLDEDSWAGIGWSLHMGRVLNAVTGSPVIEMPDGSKRPTYPNARRIGCTPMGGDCRITRDLWVFQNPYLRLPNGTVYTFGRQVANTLYATEIRDPFANQVQIQYRTPSTLEPVDGIQWIHQILAGGQTRTITFEITDRTIPNGTRLNDLSAMVLRIGGIDGAERARWTYEQDAINDLSYTLLKNVRPPEGNDHTTWKYTYSTAAQLPHLLTVAKSPAQGHFAYAYQRIPLQSANTHYAQTVVVFWRNLYDLFNNDIAWYHYPDYPAYGGGPNPAEDSRIVERSCGSTTYRYWGLGPDPSGIPAWKVGALRSRTIRQGNVEFEHEEREYLPNPQQIANQPDIVGNTSTFGIYPALLSSRTVTRNGRSYVTAYEYSSTADQLNDFGLPNTISETGEGSATRVTNRTYEHVYTVNQSTAHYSVGRLASETVTVDGESFTRSFDYDTDTGFKESETIYGITTTFAPALPGGNVASATDENGNTTAYTYDWGLVKSIERPEDPSGPAITRIVDPVGTVTSETRRKDGVSFTTSFDYDRMFRILETQPPPGLGNPVVTTYDNVVDVPGEENDRIYTLTTRGATQLRENLDGMGRVEHRINALGEQVDIDYDSCGRKSFESDPFTGPITATLAGAELTYDALDRLVQKKNRADSSTVTYRYYDGVDVDVTDEENKKTIQDWTAFGDPSEVRLAAVTDANSKTTSYTYNALGSLTSANFAEGPDRTWEYFPTNLLKKETHPENGVVSYVYDDAGLLIERRDARFPTQPTRYCYDGNRRLVRVSLPGTSGSSNCIPFDKAIVYDESDNRRSITNGADESSFDYDGVGRLEKRTDTIAGRTFETTFDYDDDDNLRLLGYPLLQGTPESARHFAEFGHDDANRVESVTWLADGQELPLADAMLYHPNGGIKTYDWGAGLAQSVSVTQDSRGRIDVLQAGTALHLDYLHDEAGNVLGIDDLAPGGVDRAFTYDNLHRLETARGAWGFGRYTYDALGNRERSTVGGTTVFDYADTTLRLTSAGAQSFLYDANGNMTSDGARTFDYTRENMPVTVTQGATVTTYGYDGDNQRTRKVGPDGTHFYFHGPGGQLISEMVQVGSETPRRVREYVFAGSRLLASVRPGSVTVTPRALAFAAVPDGPVSEPQQVDVGSEDASVFQWTATPSVPWLQVTPTTDDTPGSFMVSIDSDDVPAPGTYDAKIVVTAVDGAGLPAAGTPVDVSVHLVVSATAGLVVSPTAMSYTLAEGSIAAPRDLHVLATGSPSVDWEVEPSVSWLAATPGDGEFPGRVSVVASAADLGPGTYTGALTVTADGLPGNPFTVPVSLTVEAELGVCAANAYYCEPFDELGPGALDFQGGWETLPQSASAQVSDDPRGSGHVALVNPPAGEVSADGQSFPDRPIDGLEFSMQVMGTGVSPDHKQIAKVEFLTEDGVAWGKARRTFGAIRWGSILYVQYGANIYHVLEPAMEPGRFYEVKVRYRNGTLTAFVDGEQRFSRTNPLAGTHPFQRLGIWGWDLPGSASLDLLQVKPAAAIQPPSLLVEPEVLNFTATQGSPTLTEEARGYKVPLAFEPTTDGARYVARGPGYAALAGPQGVSLGLVGPLPKGGSSPTFASPQGERVDLRFKGAATAPRIEGEEELRGRSHYFIGKDPTKWRRGVPRFAKVRYSELYPGIDMVLYGSDGRLEYDLEVKPGADPSAIRLVFEGARAVREDGDGNLLLDLVAGTLVQKAPVVYQEVDGVRRRVAASYARTATNEVVIRLAAYDRRVALTIDPVFEYSTYLGGTRLDGASDVAVDANGSAYVVGTTHSTDFPMTDAVLPPGLYAFRNGPIDGYVVKFTPDGTDLEWAAYIGGSDVDGANVVSLDTEGAVYVAGTTRSPDFPLVNEVQEEYLGEWGDAWLMKLSPALDEIRYSTYLGGTLEETVNGLAADASGNVYLSGTTYSSDFPTFAAAQPAFGGASDGYVTKLGPSGGFLYSTYLGGADYDYLERVAVDAEEQAHVVGSSQSSNYPVVNALQPARAGAAGTSDAVYTRLAADGSTITYSTYLGGTGDDGASGVAIDTAGFVYLAGSTGSTNFPVVNPLQPTNQGQGDAFLAKLNPAGTGLVYSTYLGGTEGDGAYDVGLDGFENVYLLGLTYSDNFPVVDPLAGQATTHNFYEGFVAKVDSSGSSLVYSSYLGGANIDYPANLFVDEDGALYVSYGTRSADMPMVNAFQPVFAGGPVGQAHDGYVAKIVTPAGGPAGTLQLSAAAYSVSEGQANVSLLVRRLGGTTGEVAVNVSTAAGSATSGVDFDPLTATVVLAEGQSSAAFTVPIRPDNLDEPNETFTVALTDPTGGAVLGTPDAATVTITDDDASGNDLVQTFTVRDANNPTGPGWTAVENHDWLTLDAYAGTGPSTVTATINPLLLTAGNHTGQIQVFGAAGVQNSPRTIQVNVVVAAPQPVTLNPVADAYVRDGSSANTNFGGVTTLPAQTSGTTGSRRDVYMRFDGTALPNSVSSAKLRVFSALSAGGSVTTAAHAVSNTVWGEGTITWNNKPPLGASLATVGVTSTTYTWKELDVTTYVAAQFALGNKVLSFGFHNPSNSSQMVNIRSREQAASRPQLVVTP